MNRNGLYQCTCGHDAHIQRAKCAHCPCREYESAEHNYTGDALDDDETFRRYYGVTRRQVAPDEPRDLRPAVEISFDDIRFENDSFPVCARVICPSCQGGPLKAFCATCKGRGDVCAACGKAECFCEDLD